MPQDDTTRENHLEPPWAPMSRHLPPHVDCYLYRAGHRPHVIQARLSWESPPDAWAAVVVMDVDGGEVVLADGGQLLRCATHDAARLAAQVRLLGPVARLNRRFRTLTVDLREEGHRAVFSMVLPGEERTACG